MKTRLALAPLALLTAFALPASAADWFAGLPAQRSSQQTELAAREYLTLHASDLGVKDINLEPHRDLNNAGYRHLRYAQTWQGLPVFDKRVAVRVDAAGRVRTVMVDVARGLTASPVPGFGAAEAIARVAALGLDRTNKNTEATLGIVPDSRGGKLAWQVDVPTRAGMHRYVIDAQTGGVIKILTLAQHAKGKVYPINNKTTPNVQEVELPNLTPLTPQRLTGRAGTVYGYVSGDPSYDEPEDIQVEQKAVPDENGDFLYEPSTSQPAFDDSFAEVNLYYHLDRMDTWFREKQGVDLHYDLMVVVNFGPDQQAYDNAFYTSWKGIHKHAIFLGQGWNDDFSYDSDVFLHEFTHFVNSTAISLSNGPIDFDQYGLVIMPGAMEEGTADYFSSTVNDDPVVGEAALGPYARDLTEDVGQCPGALFGESHEDGKLIGTMGWAIRTAIGAELADALIWNTMAMLPNSPTFGDVAEGIKQGAAALKADGKIDDQKEAKVIAALTDRGLDKCPRFLDLEEKKGLTSYMLGLDFVGELMGGYPCNQLKKYLALSSTFQFKYKPEPGATSVRFKVELDDVMGSGSHNWGVYVSRDTPVLFGGGYNDPPKPDQYDHKKEGLTTTSGELVIDANSDPPFDPKWEYHVVIAHTNCAFTRATITAESSDEPIVTDAGVEAGADAAIPPPKDAGIPKEAGVADAAPPIENELVDDAEITGGACGCRTAGAPEPKAAWLLAGLAALFAARRRPRS